MTTPGYDPREQLPQLRATDSQREVVAEFVRGALHDGRLQLSELDDRLGAVYEAKTHGELGAVIDDIVPRRPPPPVPRRVATVPAPAVSEKKILPAFLLGVPFGIFGAHRFYAGKTQTAVAMLVLTLVGIGAPVTVFWWLIDLVVLAVGSFRDGDGSPMRDWL